MTSMNRGHRRFWFIAAFLVPANLFALQRLLMAESGTLNRIRQYLHTENWNWPISIISISLLIGMATFPAAFIGIGFATPCRDAHTIRILMGVLLFNIIVAFVVTIM